MSGRRYIALTVIALVVVGGGIYAWRNFPSDDTERTTVGEALQGFRQSREGGDRGRGGPELGVYRYRTSGGESVDTSIIGATHEYGGISTIILTEAGCGLVERWQPLTGRWSEVETCPGKRGDRLVRLTEFREFFGVEEELTYRCRGASTTDPPVQREGARFIARCAAENASAISRGRVVGFQKVTVGGEAFDAIHTFTHNVLEGYGEGVVNRDEWRRRSDGLLLRRIVDADLHINTAGGVEDREHYEIELISTRPRV